MLEKLFPKSLKDNLNLWVLNLVFTYYPSDTLLITILLILSTNASKVVDKLYCFENSGHIFLCTQCAHSCDRPHSIIHVSSCTFQVQELNGSNWNLRVQRVHSILNWTGCATTCLKFTYFIFKLTGVSHFLCGRHAKCAQDGVNCGPRRQANMKMITAF